MGYEIFVFIVSGPQGEVTALMMAAQGGYHKCVSILVTNGADVNMASKVIGCRGCASWVMKYYCFYCTGRDDGSDDGC